MLAKMLLPAVGGAPAVWIASMLFFQIMLLAGYGYAAITSQLLSSKKQWFVHILLFGLALFISIPLALNFPEIEATQEPVKWVLLSLLMTVGFPYFLLSASSSLLQRWYFSVTEKEPYFLFSASNAGSFLGLFSYPFLIEWLLPLSQQLVFFSIGFSLLGALFIGVFLWFKNAKTPVKDAVTKSENLTGKTIGNILFCLLYTSPSPRDRQKSRMPSSA